MLRRTSLLVVLVVVTCWAGLARAEAPVLPARMVYQAGQPIPAGYHVEHRTRYGLLISGAVLFGVAYVPTAAAAFIDSRDGTPLYVVPILGPIFAIPKKTGTKCDPDYPCPNFDALVEAFLIADAVVQAAGAIMALRGYVGRDLLIRNETAEATLVPGPVGATGYGAWLTGRF